MDIATTIHVLAQVERELDAEVQEINQMNKLKEAAERIRHARGAPDRVGNKMIASADEIVALEREVNDLDDAVKVPQIQGLGEIKKELLETLNVLREVTNGGPAGPLPGAEPSTSTDGPSPENPTQAQS